MQKIKQTTFAALAAFCLMLPACAVFDGSMTEGDVALLAQDLKDVAQAGTVYALAEKPEWRENIMLVRNQLTTAAGATETPLTFDSLLSVLQGLPIQELKSTEAMLAITASKITLRRVGRNVELGNIQNLSPIALALASGITEGLQTVPAPQGN